MVNFLVDVVLINQATLGLGESKERCIVQCSIGSYISVFVCSLLPNKNESVPLDLEFEPVDGLVTFSVIGTQSIHLSGYQVDESEDEGDDYRSYVLINFTFCEFVFVTFLSF